MRKLKVAFVNNVQYCKFPEGISNIEEFIKCLNGNYHSFVELEMLVEEGCVAPFFIEEDLKIEKSLRPLYFDDYIGQEKKKIKNNLLKFVYYGEGDIVIDQIPKVGTVVNEGSTIMLQLGSNK